MVNIFWEECKDLSFYKHICNPENILHLNRKNVIYPHIANIVCKYLEKDEENFEKIKKKTHRKQENISICLFMSLPCDLQLWRGTELRNEFHLIFKDWKDKKKYSLKSIDSYFSKSVSSPPPAGAVQKSLLMTRILKTKNNWPRNKNKKKWKKKNKEKENVDVELLQKTKNLNE